jgi:RNA recognition motif-containing protein
MSENGENGENTVIVSNLPFSMKEPEILAFCAQAGDVLKVHLTTHSNSDRSKGWA